MECKLLDKYEVGYFCSSFLVYHEDWMYFLPDPLKFVTKLGRRDMSDYVHVEEYRISCMDTMSILFDLNVCEKLSIGVAERCKGCVNDMVKLINVLYTIVHDEELFASLYIYEQNMILSKDPSLRKNTIENVKRKRAFILCVPCLCEIGCVKEYFSKLGVCVVSGFNDVDEWFSADVVVCTSMKVIEEYYMFFSRVLICMYECENWLQMRNKCRQVGASEWKYNIIVFWNM